MPSVCDIVVVIFWSRMGTPLTHNGQSYLSGTHFEFMDALHSTRTPPPYTMIYKRTAKPDFFQRGDYHTNVKQYDTLQEFLKSDVFFDPHSQGIRRGINEYNTLDEFRDRFATHFEDVVLKLLEQTPTPSQPEPPLPPNTPQIIEIKTRQWEGSPFPGLRAFEEKDLPIFFGRGRETDKLIEKVAQNRFVGVIGASGSGKSSLVRAGLIPRLRQNAINSNETGSKDWHVVTFIPGKGENHNPFDALYHAFLETFPALKPNPLEARRIRQNFLADMEESPRTIIETAEAVLDQSNAPRWAEVLLVIDQFEETFTLVPALYQAPFVAMLKAVAASARVRAVITLRSDFYHRCVEWPDLARLLEDSTFPLSVPMPIALSQIIVGPAGVANLHFEKGLDNQMVTDTGTDAGALALMAYTLDELYKIADARRAESITITYADYEALGGVQGAIGKRAEYTFQMLEGTEAEKQAWLQRVFHALVEVDERGTATRQRAALDPLVQDDGLAVFIRAFTEARLLTTSQDITTGAAQIEVAHEALLRSWERLAGWIEATQDDLRLLRQVKNAAAEWHDHNRPEYLRWNAERLTLVAAMQTRLGVQFDAITQDFIEPEQARLLRELEDINTSHQRRSAIGERLSTIGDPRPGVGLRTDGLPDIAWCYVNGGNVTIKDREFPVGSFYIAKYLVTYVQFEAFLKHPDGFQNPQWWEGFPDDYKMQEMANQRARYASYPRDTVSWYQAVAFTRWLNAVLPREALPDIPAASEIRLPTEWEWQQAATGGNPNNEYPWGDWDERRANTLAAGLARSTAVGMYPQGVDETIGALDMAGNLWEWCLNQYNDFITNINISNSSRALRGGSFDYSPVFAAGVYRNHNLPYLRSELDGFRLVVVFRY